MSLQITSSSNLQTNMPYTITGVQHYADGTKVSFSYAASNGQQLVFVAGVNVTPQSMRALYSVPDSASVCHPDTTQVLSSVITMCL